MVAPLAAIPRPGDHGRVRDAPAALELEIERLTFGPDALAHDGGQVVFVAHAAPGDRVRARVVERRRGYVRAETVAVDRAGPARVVPPCPAFGRCGGCQWQHVDVAAQRDAKAAIVAEQLARLGGLRDAPVRPTIAGGPAWAYRSRITLVAEGRRLGFHAAASHRLEPIETCAIAATPLEAHLPIARTWVARLRATVLRVTLVVAPGGVVLAATTRGRPGPADVTDTETLLAAHATVRGAILSGAGARVVVGDATVRQEIESGLALEVPADVFTQVNSEANQALVRTVVDAGGFEAGARVLDLYCGAGNLSLPLARRGADVTGIERSPVAIHAAQANAARLGVARARFVAGDVAAALASGDAAPVDGVVLDPPRTGAAAAIDGIVARRPPRIVYVSCDPATLARDVRALVARGYALHLAQPIDLFPQTYHVETVALLGLT